MGQFLQTTKIHKTQSAQVKEKVAGTQVFKLNRQNGLLTHYIYYVYID